MGELKPFDLSTEMIDQFRRAREIPVHFYNRDGQILIYRKQGATGPEIERLLRYAPHGIFYDVDDQAALFPESTERTIPDGLSDAKLISCEVAHEMTAHTSELFAELRRSSLDSKQTQASRRRLAATFDAFEGQPDAMIGLVNIIELMGDQNAPHEVELAVKRTVVAMALKIRRMKAQSAFDREQLKALSVVTMLSALLCDVGASKMDLPKELGLSNREMQYVQNHPLMSFLMLAHEGSLEAAVKHNVLCHHRPLREGAGGNNYPTDDWLSDRLRALVTKYQADANRAGIAPDLEQQLALLRSDQAYEEDLAIISLSSEFASLTSAVPWRPAFSSVRAVQMIINNLFFTYPHRIPREFLDYVAVSLCDNREILAAGVFIVVAATGREGDTAFEVCEITHSSRYQSAPASTDSPPSTWMSRPGRSCGS